MNNIITIIIPTRNEELYIENCLASILSFNVPPNIVTEILVIDGMSEDLTKEIVTKISEMNPQIKLYDNPDKIQSAAINKGIRLSCGYYIMRLDAHAIYPKDYLFECFELAQQTNADNTGGVVITLKGGNGFEASLVQAMTTHKFGVGNSSFRTEKKVGKVDTVPFGFFKKDIFDRIGLFDERLVRCQDYEFNRRIIKNGGKIWMDSKIYSEYYNQPTLKEFYAKQFFKEAPYNPYMWYLAPYAFAIRHAITGVFTSGIVLGALLSFLFPMIALIFIAVLGLYFFLAILSAIQQAIRFKNFLFIFILPICFFLYHVIHGTGIIVGVIKILTKNAPVQKSNELWGGSDEFYLSLSAQKRYLPKNK